MNTGNVVKGSSMSTASWKCGDAVPDQFPAGLRVLVVDDDPTCLMIVERMLKRCHYQVTTCNRAEKALASLQANRNGFDIVISDVHMPDMDGFKLLQLIGLEMDLPVIMMSADDGKSVVMKGVTHGACDYLIKPIRIEELKNIWQHVIRKRKGGWKEMEQSASASVDDGDDRLHIKQQHYCEDADYTSSATATEEASWKNSKRRKDEEDELDDASGLKKPRVVWSIDLHQQFVAAVNQLGIDKAVPKKILELMNVPGLTRENVASHLQKYRLYLRRLSGVSQHHFINPQDPTFGPMSSFSGLDLQTLAVAGQLQPQSLASLQAAAGFGRPSPKSAISIPLIDQTNTFSVDNSNFKFGDPDRHVSKPMSLLHGVPTAMSAQSFDNNSMQKETHLLMQQMGESQSQHRSRAPQPNGSRFPMNHHGTELPGNSFPVLINPNLASKPRYQGEVSSSKGLTGGFISGFNETQQIRSKEWDLQTVEAYLNHNSSNIRGNLNGAQTLSSSSQRNGYVGNNKIKSEVVPDRIGLFQGRFGQEDLMSVFLKQQGGVGSVSNEFDFDGYSIDNIPV